MSSAVKACSFQFLYGMKDSIYGIFMIYTLDKRIQQMHAEKRRRLQDSLATRGRLAGGRRRVLQISSGTETTEARMIGRVFMSAALSSFVWLSVWAFTDFLLPALQYHSKILMTSVSSEADEVRLAGMWRYVETGLHVTFSALWVLPLYIISKLISGFWFSDVSESVYRLLYGRPRAFPSISTAAADFVYGISVETIFLLQAYAVKHLPLEGIGYILYCVHVCLLYSLYAFEYKWFNMGMELRVRLQLVDKNWPYFCGFGLPLFVMTHLVFSYYPMVVSACIFSILFPFFIVSGTRASVPKDNSAMRLRIFEPSASFCSFLFSTSIRFRQSRNL